MPTDFDPRFNQVAPIDQQSRAIAGGEVVRLVNLTPDGIWQFRLPRLHVPVWLVYDRGHSRPELRLDTVWIEPDARRVRMTARLAVQTVRGQVLREIVLGHTTRGWQRCVDVRKRYLDFRGTGGGDPHTPAYSP